MRLMSWQHRIARLKLPVAVVATVAVSLLVSGAPAAGAAVNMRACNTYVPPANAMTTLRVAVLGDSISVGWGTSQFIPCAYVYQLAPLLPTPVASSTSVALSVQAVGGMRADQMASYATNLATMNPDIVVVELGTNDERESWPLAATQAAYSQILGAFAAAHATTLSRMHLVCLSVWPSPQFDASSQLAPYDAIIAATCALYNGVYVDLTPLYNWTQSTDFLVSGSWHPNDVGAEEIARLIVQALIDDHTFDPWCGTPQACPMPLTATQSALPSYVAPLRQPAAGGNIPRHGQTPPALHAARATLMR